MGQRTKTIERFGQAIIIPPAFHELHEFTDYLRETALPATGSDFTNSFSKPLYCLPMDDEFVKSQKAPAIVIPANAKIQENQLLVDSCVRGSDGLGDFLRDHQWIRIFGFFFELVKQNPRYLLDHGRPMALLSSFTFSRNFFTIKRLILSITRFPACLLLAKMTQSSA